MSVVGGADSVGLVAMELEGNAGVVAGFTCAEDAGTFVVQDSLIDQVVDPITGLERGVELYEGVGPEQTLIEALSYLFFDAGILYPDETSYVNQRRR